MLSQFKPKKKPQTQPTSKGEKSFLVNTKNAKNDWLAVISAKTDWLSVA